MGYIVDKNTEIWIDEVVANSILNYYAIGDLRNAFKKGEIGVDYREKLAFEASKARLSD